MNRAFNTGVYFPEDPGPKWKVLAPPLDSESDTRNGLLLYPPLHPLENLRDRILLVSIPDPNFMMDASRTSDSAEWPPDLLFDVAYGCPALMRERSMGRGTS